MKNDYSREGCKKDRLPMFHRTIKLPNGLWDKVKERGDREKKALRWIVDEALDTELLPLVGSLRQLGLKGEVKADKLVRVPLDDNVVARLNYDRWHVQYRLKLIHQVLRNKLQTEPDVD